MKFGFNYRYLIAFSVILMAIVAIALFVSGGFVRYHFGDILIVILIYCFVRIFIRNRLKLLPLYIFAFAVLVEIGQYFGLIYMLGLENSQFARIVIGTTFDVWDIVMYFIGCVVLFIYDWLKNEIVC